MAEHDAKKSVDMKQHSPSIQDKQVNPESPAIDLSAICRAIQLPRRQTLTPKTVMQLQRLWGNSQVSRFTNDLQIQRKIGEDSQEVQRRLDSGEQILVKRRSDGRIFKITGCDRDGATNKVIYWLESISGSWAKFFVNGEEPDYSITQQTPSPSPSPSSGPDTASTMPLPTGGISQSILNNNNASSSTPSTPTGITSGVLKVVEGRITYLVRYEPAPATPRYMGKQVVVHLPSGLLQPAIDSIVVQLGMSRDAIFFVNDQGDTFDYEKDGVQLSNSAPPSKKIERAKQIVKDFLRSLNKIVDEEVIDTLITSITNQQVAILNENWNQYFRGNNPGSGNPNETEGLTNTKKQEFGSRTVGINSNNYTLNAIVHELFHTLESNGIQRLWNGLNDDLIEAITEFLTQQSTGLTQRLTVNGSTVYSDQTRWLNFVLAEGWVMAGELLRAYFLNERTPNIVKLNGLFAHAMELEASNRTARIRKQEGVDIPAELRKYWNSKN